MFLLLIDLLGVKARWAKGRAEAESALAAFDKIVLDGLNAAGTTPATGGIDSDAAAFVFDDLGDALATARSIYLVAFCTGDPLTDERYWIRGVVMPMDGAETRTSVPLPAPHESISRSVYSPSLMDAVCVEASGHLKGMRVIVSSDVIDQSTRDRFAVKTNNGHLVPFRRLNMSQYPPGEWEDFLWMVPDDPDDWEEVNALARTRMRAAGRDSTAELDQAAHTRVAFDQVGAMLFMQHIRGS